MNIDLRPSTRRIIEDSPTENGAIAVIEWLRTERYTHYTIDCHTRRLLCVTPQLEADASPPVPRIHGGSISEVVYDPKTARLISATKAH